MIAKTESAPFVEHIVAVCMVKIIEWIEKIWFMDFPMWSKNFAV